MEIIYIRLCCYCYREIFKFIIIYEMPAKITITIYAIKYVRYLILYASHSCSSYTYILEHTTYIVVHLKFNFIIIEKSTQILMMILWWAMGWVEMKWRTLSISFLWFQYTFIILLPFYSIPNLICYYPFESLVLCKSISLKLILI